jgi:hypothetical protein
MRVASTLLVLIAVGLASVGSSAQSSRQNDAVLRKKCAHALKVRLGIKETGKVEDLQGVKGAVAQVDRCVANGGKLD